MLNMKRIGLVLMMSIILGGLWIYIDHRENDCLSAGICPKGYQFNSCDWKGCVVDEDSCQGRGRWDKKQEICFFNISVSSGFEKGSYDLFKESQFGNGFAMIKDSYGKRLNPKQDEPNYIDGIMAASVMFGEMDLLSIKKQVIDRMDNPEAEKDEEGIWRPLYDAVRKTHGHEYDMIDAWVYWFIFNPQLDNLTTETSPDHVRDVSILTAVSRADVKYWHQKTMSCLKGKMALEEMQDLNKKWIDATQECLHEYNQEVGKIAAEIYPRLKALSQH